MAASMVSCIAILAVLDHTEILPSAASQEERSLGGAGLVGLSLSYALPLTGLLNQLLTTSAETEQEMVAVERILEYSSIEPQVPQCFLSDARYKPILPICLCRSCPAIDS
jgi:ABC-type multidrug transport system fused ATPase/permease subunit